MRLAMLPNRDPERASRCLLLPRVALGNLGLPSCDSLHRPGLRVLLTLPMRASSSKQAPRGLKPAVEGWRLIATRDESNLRPLVARVKTMLPVCQLPLQPLECRRCLGGPVVAEKFATGAPSRISPLSFPRLVDYGSGKAEREIAVEAAGTFVSAA